jgi:hypothetical protein
MSDLPSYVTPQQLADMLQVPIGTIRKWRHVGQGPPGFRAGKHLRYELSGVLDWVAAQRSAASGVGVLR